MKYPDFENESKERTAPVCHPGLDPGSISQEPLSGSTQHGLRVKPAMTSTCSVQSEGGPRLNGSPGTAALASAGKFTVATWVPGKQGMAATCSAGSARPTEPHRSQCMPAWAGLPSLESESPAEAVLTEQIPPSLPARTSWASMDTGATNADSTARKLSQAARRAHTESARRGDGRWDTAGL